MSVLTDVEGDRHYCAVLCFNEPADITPSKPTDDVKFYFNILSNKINIILIYRKKMALCLMEPMDLHWVSPQQLPSSTIILLCMPQSALYLSLHWTILIHLE